MADNSINDQIAELLKRQTFAERMEMAEWFRDVVSDLVSDENLSMDSLANAFENWAESQLEDEATHG